MAELLDLCKRVVSWARPDEQVEAVATRRRATSVRVYESEVESFTSAEPSGIGIRVLVDGRQGFASAGVLDETVAKEMLEEARDNAAFAEPDEFVALATPDDLPKPMLDGLYCEFTVAAGDKIAKALELERMTKALDPRVRVRSAAWGDSSGEQALASTKGMESCGRLSSCQVSVSALAEEDGQTQTGGGVSYGRSPEDLDLAFAANEAVHDAVRMLGATKPRSAKLTAVFTAEIALQFLGVVSRMLSGEAVIKGRTPFADRLGEAIAAPLLTLVDDPTDPASLNAWPDDDEGITSRRNVLIDGGALRMFLYDTYSGRRAGTGSTGSAVRGYASTPAVGIRAMSVVPGPLSHEDVLKSVGDGVLVQSVTGMHSGVSPVSGDFSVGAAGLMIRGGRIAEPVQEMTVASTIQRMLLDIAIVGGDLRWFGGSAAATLAIRDIALGGM